MVGEFGFLLANGNTNTSSVTAKINASQEFNTWSYQIISDLLYSQSEREENGKKINSASAQRIFLSNQIDYKLNHPEERIFVYGEFENNRFSGFRYRAAIAAGWASRLWHDHENEFRYSIGPGYAFSKVEEQNAEDIQEGLIIRAAAEYKRKFSKQATFRQFLSAEVNKNFTNTKSETSLSTKLSGALAMKISLTLNHDSVVSDKDQELNTEAMVTFVYQFF
jgi:putative salt-induced outer membrane protein